MLLQTLNILRRIRDEPALQNPNKGLCPIVQELMEKEGGMQPNTFGSVQRMLKEIFKQWDQFSGDELYPVKHPRRPNAPSSAYTAYRTSYDAGNMWKGTYGESRRNLLQFAIAYIENRLDAYTPLEEINKVLEKIQPGLCAEPRGFEYTILNAKSWGILPLYWRTGHVMYGYNSTPTPSSWFIVDGKALELFVREYKDGC